MVCLCGDEMNLDFHSNRAYPSPHLLPTEGISYAISLVSLCFQFVRKYT
jgi:hypothetical protein